MDTNLKAWITRKNGQWEVSLNLPDWVYDDILLDGENNTGLAIDICRGETREYDFRQTPPDYAYGIAKMEPVVEPKEKEEADE